MAIQQFSSLDEIEKHYGKLIKASEDEEEQRALRLDQREATAEYRERAAAQATLDAHKATVVAAKNLGEWADLIRGTTPEEIDAEAAKIEERVAKLAAPAAPGEQPTAAEMYGRPATQGGAAPARRDESLEKRDDFQKRWNASTRGSRVQTSPPGESVAGYTVQEGERWVKDLGAAHLIDHLARNSSKPTVRAALSKIDPNTLKER